MKTIRDWTLSIRRVHIGPLQLSGYVKWTIFAVAVGFSLLYQQISYLELGYRRAELDQARRRLLEKKRSLLAKQEALLSPSRIIPLARKMGLTHSNQKSLRILKVSRDVYDNLKLEKPIRHL